jgi:hypothetical protein
MNGRRTVTACAGTLAMAMLAGCASGATSAGPPGSGSSGGNGASGSSTVSIVPPPANSANPASGSGSVPSATGSALSCTAGQLSVKLSPLQGAAAGTQFYDVVETNTSPQTCWVKHSVKLRLSDAYRQQIPIPVEEGPEPGTVVTLTPGASAAQTLAYSSDGNPPSGRSTCATVEKYVEITVADEPQPTVLPGLNRGYCPHDTITLTNLIAGSSSPP